MASREASSSWKTWTIIAGGALVTGTVVTAGICGSGHCSSKSSEAQQNSLEIEKGLAPSGDTLSPSLAFTPSPALLSLLPTRIPSCEPINKQDPAELSTDSPTLDQTASPTRPPSESLSNSPTNNLKTPSQIPTADPTSSHPSQNSSTAPTDDGASQSRTHLPSSEPTGRPTNKPARIPSFARTQEPTARTHASTRNPTPTPLPLDGRKGALVTDNCQFRDYSYAIDIEYSCGVERFNQPVRLHTFKRHSYSHKRVFNDQLLSYRNSHLWFDEYSTPRCIVIRNSGEFRLDTSGCSLVKFVPRDEGHLLRYNGQCAGLGQGASCNSDRSTGGNECGGIDHRFLPLVMTDCSEGLIFRFETRAEGCSNEFPENACF